MNGETVVGYDFRVTIGSTLVSWGTVNTYSQGAAGSNLSALLDFGPTLRGDTSVLRLPMNWVITLGLCK